MRRVLASACAALVATSALAATARPSAAVRPDDGDAALHADAEGPLRIHREGGVATFVGTPSGSAIDNPGVNRRTAVAVAARAHLDRYGDAIGADRPGTTLVEHDEAVTPQGTGVVRYAQQVAGVPVLGADVVVTLDENRDLASLDAHLSDATAVPAPTVTEAAARTTALERAGRGHVAGATARSLGRWLVDPTTVPVDGLATARAAWRFEVRAGIGVRRMVLVDDRAGVVLLDVDLVQDVDRVVCNQNQVVNASPPPCTTGAVRTEATGASLVQDVNNAFVFSGLVSDFYKEFLGNGDDDYLTNLIGYGAVGAKKLASTVRVCLAANACPYANAFWDGRAMFYGSGYTAADDVVGHEMTHGVIERKTGLLYWDQSGAINESLADIIGEIIDHRRAVAGESASQFVLGEDLPTGALRSMSNPPQYADPDRVRSPYWYSGEGDSGGVHLNSGVGNKAFFLISQGGTFNGQTVTGIDVGDADLSKSAQLWVRVIETIPAVAEYDDLADVLEQACDSLQGDGFTADDCTAVDQVVLATEMRQRPTVEPLRDAPPTCAAGTFRRDLFSSESGADQVGKLTAPSGGWTRTPASGVVPNASSDGTSWYGEEGETGQANIFSDKPLRASSWVTIPSGQPAYLSFRHWHVFEYETTDGATNYWDGGTVELLRDGSSTVPLAGATWTNGPTRTLKAGPTGFGGSSKGWYGSQVDLSAYGGQSIKPQFTMRYDQMYGAPGWYLDDIVVHTCDPPLAADVAPTLPAVNPHVGVAMTVTAPTWNLAGAATSYQWRRDGQEIDGAHDATYTPAAADEGAVLSVVVTGTLGDQVVPVTLTAPGPVEADPPPLEATTAPTLPSSTPQVGAPITVTAPVWNKPGVVTSYQWLRGEQPIAGATEATYIPVAADAGMKLTVVATGALGDETASATATAAEDVRPALDVVAAPSLPAGAPRVGRALTVSAPTWNLSGTTVAYQWCRGGQPIPGATQARYTPVAADLGTRLSVVVTGSYSAQTRSITATASANTVAGLLTAPRTVRTTGTPYAGRRLMAVRGTWAPTGITFSYRWLRDGKAITGATRASFVLRKVDKGHRIAVRITGREAGYATVVRTSAAVLVRR